MHPDYLDAEMIQRLAERRAKIIAEFGFLLLDQAPHLSELHHRHEIFALPNQEMPEDADVFPLFQFDGQGHPLPIIKQVLTAFGDQKDPWKLAMWFTSNNGWLLGQARPVDLLKSDPAAILEAAQRDAKGSAT